MVAHNEKNHRIGNISVQILLITPLNFMLQGVTSEVLNEFIKGETYTLEYIVSAPDAPRRHIQSVFALRPQESVVGLTVQTKEVKSCLTFYSCKYHQYILFLYALRPYLKTGCDLA